MSDHTPERQEIDTHPSDIRTALSDAIADLLHIHNGDQSAVLVELGVALEAGREHYAVEASGAEGIVKVYTQAGEPDSLHQIRIAGNQFPRLTELSPDAHRVLCGLVQPSDVVDADDITAGPNTWAELRRTFPASGYRPEGEDGGDEQPAAGESAAAGELPLLNLENRQVIADVLRQEADACQRYIEEDKLDPDVDGIHDPQKLRELADFYDGGRS